MSCLKCNSPINERTDKFIKCDGCNRSVHISCSELSDVEIKCFTLRANVRRRMKYICIDCEQGVHQIPKLITLISDLKDEIRLMQEKYNRLVSDVGVKSVGSSDMAITEEVINEIHERSKRSQNIIIYSCPEEGNSKQDQIQRDTVTVQNLLTKSGVAGDQIKPVRLGKFDSTQQQRKRPIRVRLVSSEDVLRVVRKFREIKLNSQFSHLSVAVDRTPKQMAFYRSVRDELNTRIARGETNLKIKHKNGIPTIIKYNMEN